jgi:hypothetical protein
MLACDAPRRASLEDSHRNNGCADVERRKWIAPYRFDRSMEHEEAQ